MNERFGPRTIEPELVRDLWRELKIMRDKMFNWQLQAGHGQDRLDAILARMKEAGMADWIPSIEEVQAAWRGDQEIDESGKSVEIVETDKGNANNTATS